MLIVIDDDEGGKFDDWVDEMTLDVFLFLRYTSLELI